MNIFVVYPFSNQCLSHIETSPLICSTSRKGSYIIRFLFSQLRAGVSVFGGEIRFRYWDGRTWQMHPDNTHNKRLLIQPSHVCHRRCAAGRSQQVESKCLFKKGACVISIAFLAFASTFFQWMCVNWVHVNFICFDGYAT